MSRSAGPSASSRSASLRSGAPRRNDAGHSGRRPGGCRSRPPCRSRSGRRPGSSSDALRPAAAGFVGILRRRVEDAAVVLAEHRLRLSVRRARFPAIQAGDGCCCGTRPCRPGRRRSRRCRCAPPARPDPRAAPSYQRRSCQPLSACIGPIDGGPTLIAVGCAVARGALAERIERARRGGSGARRRRRARLWIRHSREVASPKRLTRV